MAELAGDLARRCVCAISAIRPVLARGTLWPRRALWTLSAHLTLRSCGPLRTYKEVGDPILIEVDGRVR